MNGKKMFVEEHKHKQSQTTNAKRPNHCQIHIYRDGTLLLF
jgi:hypothetical protein